MSASLDDVLSLPQIVRSLRSPGVPLAVRKEAVISLGLLCLAHAKHIADEQLRERLSRQFKNLWNASPSKARAAWAVTPGDRLAREQRDAVIAERALRLRQPAVVAQLFALATRTQGVMPHAVARGLACYVLPIAVAINGASADWAKVLDAFSFRGGYVHAAQHGRLVIERVLSALAPAALADGAAPELRGAWHNLFVDFVTAVDATRTKAAAARKGGLAYRSTVARVLRAAPAGLASDLKTADRGQATAAAVACVGFAALGRINAVPADTVKAVLNEAPGAFAKALGCGRVLIDAGAETLDALLPTIAAHGLAGVADVCAVVRCSGADAAAVEAILMENARVQKLCDPILKASANTYAVANADAIGALYADALPLTSEMVTKLLTTAGGMLSRCSTANDRVALLRVCFAVLARARDASPDATPTSAAALAMLKPVIASPVAEVLAAAWSVAALLPDDIAAALEPAMKPLVRQAGTNEATRRCVFAGAPSTLTDVGPVAGPFIKDAAATPAFRPEALLALRIPAAVAASKLSNDKAADACFTSDGIDGLAPHFQPVPCLPRAAFRAASRLAAEGVLRGLAVTAAHRNGSMSRMAVNALADAVKAGGAGVAIQLWTAVTRCVFGIAAKPQDVPVRDADERDSAFAAFSANGPQVLQVAARAILQHAGSVAMDEVLAEIAMCIGGTLVCGNESALLRSRETLGGTYQPRGVDSARCRAVVHGIFKHAQAPASLKDTVDFAAKGAGALLIAQMERVGADIDPAVTRAAVNGFAVLLSLVPAPTQRALFAALTASCGRAATAIASLDAMTLAIASPVPGAVADFVLSELAAKGLVKNHGPKPPKGMSEDDFEDMVRKDRKALDEARAKMLDKVAAATEKLGSAPQLYAVPFVALRVAATLPGATFDQSGAEALLWLVKRLGEWTEVDENDVPKAHHLAVQFAHEAAAELMFAMTPGVPRLLAALFVRVAARMQAKVMTHTDAAQANTLALKLRVAGVTCLPAALFPSLLPLLRGAFRVVKGRTAPQVSAQGHHQLMALFAATAGLPNLPARPEGLEFAVHAIINFGAVFKMAQSSLASLARGAEPAELQPLLRAALCGEAMTREAAASALAGSDVVDSSRQIRVSLACLRYDARAQVTKIAERRVGADFAFTAEDLPVLAELLKRFAATPYAVSVLASAVHALVVAEPGALEAAVDVGVKLPVTNAAIAVVRRLIPTMTTPAKIGALKFLIGIAENPDTCGDDMRAVLQAGRDALSKASDDELRKEVAPAVQPKLQQLAAAATGKGEHKEQLAAAVTSWLTVIATRSNDAAYLSAVLESLPPMLQTAQSPTVHYTLAECVSDLARHPALRKSDQLLQFGELCLKSTFNSSSYVKKKSHANAFAGIILGAGLSALRRFNTLQAINDAAQDKQAQRSGAMVLIETLALNLGVLFEPYLLVLTQLMLDAVAEKDPKIAECADDAAKAMMSSLSDVGLRQLVPRLVEGLQAEQNKKKQSSLALISYIAYCSPKQLAAALPTVVPHVCDCLMDANGGTANAAFTALRRVAGVVANMEIQQHVDVILDAMRRPDQDTEVCLDALLYTRFSTAIDPASLALLIPVVARGLGERSSDIRGKAAQIVASLVSLVADPKKALLPYAADLIQRLELTSQDPQAGVRATSAKAMSLLVATLSKEHVDNAVEWCKTMLHRAGTSSAEKCGAAQVLMEICAVVGEGLVGTLMPEIEKGCKDEAAGVREAFVTLFVYAPSALPVETFTGFLPAFFPFVLEGLADTAEKVRTVALQAGTNIINQHGLRHLNLVLAPLLEGVVSETPSARQSSLLLSSKLLIHIVTEHRRKHRMNEEAHANGSDADEAEEDGEGASGIDNTLRLDSARDAERGGTSILGHLEETLGEEGFVRLLAAMHIARSEHNATVRQEVITAWQVCVASPRTALNKIANGIVQILVKFASSDRPECVDLAEKCIGYTCQRIHEMIDKFLVAFTQHYAGPTERHKIGALFCIAETVPCSEKERILKFTPQICSAVLPALRAESEIVRGLAATVSERVTKVVGKSWNDDIVQRQLQSESVVGVVEVVRANTRHSIKIVAKALSAREVPTQYDIDLMKELVQLDECANDFVMHYDAITTVLCNGVVHGLEGAEEALSLFAEFIIAVEYYPNNFTIFQNLLKTPHTRAAALRAIAAFFRGLPATATEAIILGQRLVLQSFGDADGNVRDTAARSFIGMTQALDEKAQAAATAESPGIDATTLRKAAGRFALQFVDTVQASLLATIHATCLEDEPELPILRFPKLVDTVLQYYYRALDYGTAGVKLQALDGIEQVIGHVSVTARPVLLNGVMAKCIKLLYERNDGAVISAVVTLLLRTMDFDKSGKNKILERTIATAVFGATLSDAPEARTLGLRLATELLRRDPAYADVMLATAVTKKAAVDSPSGRASMCRYISVVLRHGDPARPVKNLAQLQALVRPLWEAPDMILTGAAAGTAMAAMARTASMPDDEVGAIADAAVSMAAGNGARAVAGMATLYGLLTCARSRVESETITATAATVRGVLPSCGTDRLTALWALRLATELAAIDAAHLGKIDAAQALLQRVEISDDLMMSTAAYAINTLAKVFPAAAPALNAGKFGESGIWGDIGTFDVDFEDEHSSANITY